MTTIKQELRLVTQDDYTMKFVLSDAPVGMSVREFAGTCGTDFTIGGLADVLSDFRKTERNRTIPCSILSAIATIGGLGLCCWRKYPVGIGAMTAGCLGFLSSLFRSHALMFRDKAGNEVDLFLGIVYVAGTNHERFLQFSSFTGGDGVGLEL